VSIALIDCAKCGNVVLTRGGRFQFFGINGEPGHTMSLDNMPPLV
jgi:hypothetical protein